MSIIADNLEERCRHIVRNIKRRASEPTPATFVGREMALNLDQMDVIRERQKELKAQLLKRELEIGTQILNTEERADLVPNKLARMQLVNELKQMLDQIKSQTQHLIIENESALYKLQTRLLQLWNIHDQLSFEHGYPKYTT
jgi:hypothetical protein